ncbi:Positive regulator of purine utilization [Teratosphaeria destructans]|uniref:Positive regulator of purine utilization n=1 Tax=Teratosphaeria destructans TaxID=418781 RepID=A0A9W7W4Z2_9PEZI|nr:Positive regulator of purine utilization [Teratosphaeria destructans]
MAHAVDDPDTSPPAAATPTTNFRSNCAKVKVKCVGFDPISRREIPRSYVYFLEQRVQGLEQILDRHDIPCPPLSEDFAISGTIKPGENVPYPVLLLPEDGTDPTVVSAAQTEDTTTEVIDPALKASTVKRSKSRADVQQLASASTQAASDPRRMGSGIPFSQVVLAAVKSSVPAAQTPSVRPSKASRQSARATTSSDSSGSDTFFGLNTKTTVTAASFPDREVALPLVDLYFEHANPQIPILHRGEFASLFERVYATDVKKRGHRELYLLNIVFAIGSGIIVDSCRTRDEDGVKVESRSDAASPRRKRQRTSPEHAQPEEYHAAAITHLDRFLSSAPTAQASGGGLEELQAVLLLAGFALLRPVAPGLWYIIGVAVRLAVDLGLHFEEVDHDLDSHIHATADPTAEDVARRQWSRDLRRRLWWCTYSLDRLVSTCVGRPLGISDQPVTTEFPSLLDDRNISPSGFSKPPNATDLPSYKFVAHHYFRLRLLQSEILQVLQHRQAEQSRAAGANRHNPWMHTQLPSPFVQRFRSFRDWRADIDLRLGEWKGVSPTNPTDPLSPQTPIIKILTLGIIAETQGTTDDECSESAPSQAQSGVAFNPLFFDLNYWQAILTLYRPSLTVPEALASELTPSTGGDVPTPGPTTPESQQDADLVYLKLAQAGQTVLAIYQTLHRLKLVNYTYLATHHLFTSACRDAFARMGRATLTYCLSSSRGSGAPSTLASHHHHEPGDTPTPTDARGDVDDRRLEILGADRSFGDDMGFIDDHLLDARTDANEFEFEFDLGFGTGGTGYDGTGNASAWEANGGVDLFDGFFFGSGGGGGNATTGY